MRPNEKKKERDGGVLYYQKRTKKNFLVESRETRRDERAPSADARCAGRPVT